jgi:hypothetical protein
MGYLIKSLKVLGIVAATFVFFFVLDLLSGRSLLSHWMILSSLVLPVAFWFRLGFAKCCLASLLIALGLAASPIDFMVRNSDRPGLRLLPTSYGYGCQPGTACYGCLVPPNRARKAIVLSF